MMQTATLEIADRSGRLPAGAAAAPPAEEWWRAVESRDRRADGAFVFAVRTTGVYCRPSCPARRPKRRNVRFFQGPNAAEAAGFRACRRCHPRDLPSRVVEAAWVRRVCRQIEDTLDRPVRLRELGAKAGVSPDHLARRFKRATGLSPRQYAEARRLAAFKERLRKGNGVNEAIYEAGYGSSSRAYEKAPARLGMTPAAYRRGGLGLRLDYTIVDSALGRLLVAATERGISAVCLGDSDAVLEEALRTEYPRAELTRDQRRLRGWVRTLVRQLEGEAPEAELPLDIRATAFQWRVWQQLRAIPRGQTRTYGEVARRIGSPRAVRAVARACATNPVAVAIPCHRVVPKTGGLGGYRWGAEKKKALLERERLAAK
jgi:AraC family transcriptional regulator, regulatory protein of adaptative response / methylated-DNA-[protein]-cysteine methyltransferase